MTFRHTISASIAVMTSTLRLVQPGRQKSTDVKPCLAYLPDPVGTHLDLRRNLPKRNFVCVAGTSEHDRVRAMNPVSETMLCARKASRDHSREKRAFLIAVYGPLGNLAAFASERQPRFAMNPAGVPCVVGCRWFHGRATGDHGQDSRNSRKISVA